MMRSVYARPANDQYALAALVYEWLTVPAKMRG